MWARGLPGATYSHQGMAMAVVTRDVKRNRRIVRYRSIAWLKRIAHKRNRARVRQAIYRDESPRHDRPCLTGWDIA